MKKNYITPAIGNMCMDTAALLQGSLNHADTQEAAEGTSDNPVNLGRGSFWDETQ